MKNSVKIINNLESRYFFLILWKKKKLIFLSSLICAFLLFGYQKFLTKNLSLEITTIVIKKPLSQIFNIYGEFLYDRNVAGQKPLSDEFFSNFKINLSSNENLHLFINDYLNKKRGKENYLNINKNLNHSFEFGVFGKDINTNKFFLKYPSQFDGPNLLNEYVLFTYHKTIDEFIEDLKINIEYRSNKLKAEKKNISTADDEIIRLGQLIRGLDQGKFKFDPILDKAVLRQNYINQENYIYLGFFIGLFFSIFFIFFRVTFFNFK
jgi:LPS O-antigen subunit length determinant protein (WzzB/FepE family)